jgi:hypothetical protein
VSEDAFLSHLVAALKGKAAVQRRRHANKLELISVWSSPQGFDDHLAEATQQQVRSSLEGELLAPVDDRRCTLTARRRRCIQFHEPVLRSSVCS